MDYVVLEKEIYFSFLLIYDFLFPRRTCYADRPGGSQIMAAVNPQSSREELTQLSTDVVPTQTQMSGFVKDGKLEILAKSNKDNQNKVIGILQKMGY